MVTLVAFPGSMPSVFRAENGVTILMSQAVKPLMVFRETWKFGGFLKVIL